jgi:hypothetical protein
MNSVKTIFVASLGAATLLSIVPCAAWAQGMAPSPASPSTIPEKDPIVTGNLSDKLKVTNGVIQPPAGVDPQIQAQAPNPEPGSTAVIPPPGTPGNQPNVQPK